MVQHEIEVGLNEHFDLIVVDFEDLIVIGEHLNRYFHLGRGVCGLNIGKDFRVALGQRDLMLLSGMSSQQMPFLKLFQVETASL